MAEVFICVLSLGERYCVRHSCVVPHTCLAAMTFDAGANGHGLTACRLPGTHICYDNGHLESCVIDGCECFTHMD